MQGRFLKSNAFVLFDWWTLRSGEVGLKANYNGVSTWKSVLREGPALQPSLHLRPRPDKHSPRPKTL